MQKKKSDAGRDKEEERKMDGLSDLKANIFRLYHTEK